MYSDIVKLFVLCILLLEPVHAALAGGAGKSIHFTGPHQYAIVPNVTFDPIDDFTVEMWFKSTSWVSTNFYTLVSYALPEDDNAFQVQWGSGYWLQYNNFLLANTTAPGTESMNYWNHIALTIHGSSGTISCYLNGSLLASSVVGTIPALRGGGALVFAQEQDSVGGDFDTQDTFLGQIDEFRMWKTARTQSQIQAYLHRTLSPAEAAAESNLILHFGFDDASNPLAIKESKNANNNALMGNWDPYFQAVPNCPCSNPTYITGPGVTDPPLYANSKAPIYGKPLYVSCNPAPSHIIITLAAFDTSGGSITYRIDTLPQHGTLYTTADGTTRGSSLSGMSTLTNNLVWFEPSATFGTNGDSFLYTATSSSGSSQATVHITYNNAPLSFNVTSQTTEDVYTFIALTCWDPDGDFTKAIIADLPVGGSLVQWVPDYYVPGDTISAPNTPLLHPGNLVIFSPPTNFFGTISFTFYCTDENGLTSGVSTATVNVAPVDDKPFVGGGLFMLHFNGFNVFLEGLYNKQYPVRTVEFWVEPYPSPVNNNRMTVFAASGLTVSLLDFGVSVQAAADEEVTTAPLALNPAVWNHVAVVIDDTGKVSIYVNATLVPLTTDAQTISLSGLLVDNSNVTLHVGRDNNSSNHLFAMLEELRLWGTPLSESDIAYFKLSKPIGNETNLLAWYQFDDATGSLARDSSLTLPAAHLTLAAENGTDGAPLFMASTLNLYDTIYTEEDTPTIIRLWARDVEDQDIAYVITKLPEHGRLFQVLDDGTIGPEITQAYRSWVQNPPTEQWVSRIQNYSSFYSVGHLTTDVSCRNPDPFCFEAPYTAWQLIGAPQTYDVINPQYGDSPFAWCPGVQCWKEHTDRVLDREWIEVEYDTPVYAARVEVYENYNPGAVIGIYTRDPTDTYWSPLYTGSANPKSAYSVFKPQICQKLYKTSKLRIELDTCQTPGWNEIDAIKLVGTDSLLPGVVSNTQMNLVLYVPNKDGYGVEYDSFEFKAIDCPYDPDRESKAATIKITVAPVNDDPVVEPLHFSLTEGQRTLLSFYPADNTTAVDADDNDVLSVHILSLPSIGKLYEVNDDGSVGKQIIGTPHIVKHSVIFDSPFDKCGVDLTTFQFVVMDSHNASSSVSTATLSIFCLPGKFAIDRALLWVMGVVTGLCLIFLICVAIFTAIHRAKPQFKLASPPFLAVSLVGAMLAYYSNYLFMLEQNLNPAVCHIRVWMLSLGFQLLMAPSFAKTWRIWRIFSNKTLKVRAIPDKVIMTIVLMIVGVDCVFLVLFSAIDPPQVVSRVSTLDPAVTILECTANTATLSLVIVLKVALLLFGVVVCVTTRKVMSAFNESKWIALTIYNMFFVALIVIPVLVFVRSDNPAFYFMIHTIAVIECVTVTITLMFGPKIVSVLKKERVSIDYWSGSNSKKTQFRSESKSSKSNMS